MRKFYVWQTEKDGPFHFNETGLIKRVLKQAIPENAHLNRAEPPWTIIEMEWSKEIVERIAHSAEKR